MDGERDTGTLATVPMAPKTTKITFWLAMAQHILPISAAPAPFGMICCLVAVFPLGSDPFCMHVSRVCFSHPVATFGHRAGAWGPRRHNKQSYMTHVVPVVCLGHSRSVFS